MFVCKEGIERNVFNLPTVSERCPICLINKKKTTNHCNRCNRCVNDFYFHWGEFFYNLRKMGSDIEYTDDLTLANALKGRTQI